LEANEISQVSGLKITDFSEPSASGTYTLRMKKKARRCIFLDGAQCRIYDRRPIVCQFYPLWLRQDNATYIFGITNECPGVGKGRRIERSHYLSLLGLAQERLNV
jgi:Fe-S-cluster containining protein